jgi:hypothetical protein
MGQHRLVDSSRGNARSRTPGRVIVWLAAAATLIGTASIANAAGASSDSADPNPNCSIRVPSQPLTASGLATPYVFAATDQEAGPCDESNPDQSAFVQATILDPATGELSVYSPLVINEGSRPAFPPVKPILPKHAIVGIWFGYNGDTLTLTGNGRHSGRCVNGLGSSLFTQYAYCNAPAFFQAANAAITSGKLTPPGAQTASDGQPCPTVRDFSLVDQDQSDNVTSTYLSVHGRTAQNTEATRVRFGDRATELTNGSDNGLLDAFVDPALGCAPFTAANLADPGAVVTSLALNELDAAANQVDPVALVPTNDPMTTVDSRSNVAKTNLYRVGVDQKPLARGSLTGRTYCQDMFTVGMRRISTDRSYFVKGPSPDPADANLFAFLADRLSGSFGNLGCGKLLGQHNPVRLVTDHSGVVIDAMFGQLGGRVH